MSLFSNFQEMESASYADAQELVVTRNGIRLYDARSLEGKVWAGYHWTVGSDAQGGLNDLMISLFREWGEYLAEVSHASQAYRVSLPEGRVADPILSAISGCHNRFATLDLNRVSHMFRSAAGLNTTDLVQSSQRVVREAKELFSVVLLQDTFDGRIPYRALEMATDGGSHAPLERTVRVIERSGLTVGQIDSALRILFPDRFIEVERVLLRSGCRRLLEKDPEQMDYRETLGTAVSIWGERTHGFRVYPGVSENTLKVAGPNRVTLLCHQTGLEGIRLRGIETFAWVAADPKGKFIEVRRLVASAVKNREALTHIVKAMVDHNYLIEPFSADHFQVDGANKPYLMAPVEEVPFDFEVLERFVKRSVVNHPDAYQQVMVESGLAGTRVAITIRQAVDAALKGEDRGEAFLQKLDGDSLKRAVADTSATLKHLRDLIARRLTEGGMKDEQAHAEALRLVQEKVESHLVGSLIVGDWCQDEKSE